MAQHKNQGSQSGNPATAVAEPNVLEKARDTAVDVASTVAEKVGDAASYVGKKADTATSALGSGMKNLGGTIREHTPSSGVVGSATGAVADAMETSGRYLQEHGLSGIGEDLTNMIRRNPIPALLVGIGVGFLIARATRSS
jgi:hypothetical protein